MSERSLPSTHTEKKIGGATYIVTTSYNGDKNYDIVKSVVRLIERGAFSPQN